MRREEPLPARRRAAGHPLPGLPDLKAEFDQRRSGAQQAERQPDARLAQIERLKNEGVELRARLGRRDVEITELKTFRAMALSRLAAQHDEITALRAQLQTINHANARTLPTR